MTLQMNSEKVSSHCQFQETEAVLRAIIESPRDIVIFALDRQYRYMAFNANHVRTMKQIWGSDVRVGVSMLDLIGRDDDRERARANFDRALSGESFTQIEEYGDSRMERRCYEDVYSPVHDGSGRTIGLAVYLTDVTEHWRAQRELDQYRSQLEELVQQRTQELEIAHATLLHAQKLESLGVLAGGIAHDFNNLLAIVLAHAELCARQVATQTEARTHLGLIRETALEARLLVKQLLSYAGKGESVLEDVELNGIVRALVQLLRATISKEIRLECDLHSELLAVRGDASQLRQVILNLVTNAAESIGSRTGQIKVRTGLSTVTAESLKSAYFSSDLQVGTCAYLEVEDTGPGISEEAKGKLFDPFFTTKFPGRGLGLAAVLGIVRSHGGAILLEAAPLHGSRFRVLLPTADPATLRETERRASEAQPASNLLSPPTKSFVMVVDDEAPVRAATAQVLRSIGYAALEADSGATACELLRQHHSEIDLVLLDFAMPDMNGQQTLHALKQLKSELPIILLTAYAEAELGGRFQSESLAGFIVKPFTCDELATAIAAVAPLTTSSSTNP
ncbi:MAG TPA: response regulator, partial [Polyangiaceae bacterium]